jgi:hypothetical protein
VAMGVRVLSCTWHSYDEPWVDARPQLRSVLNKPQ